MRVSLAPNTIRTFPEQRCEGLHQFCEPTTGTSERHERFLRLFTASYRSLYSYILALVGSRADADDLMQETSLLLWRKFDQFELEVDDPEGNFVRWARTFARNLIRNFHRMRRAKHHAFDDDLISKLAAVQVAADELLELRREALRSCLEKLSRADRELLQVCYSEHRSVASAAERLARPSDAVYKKLRKIRQALFHCITRTLDQFGGVP